MQRFVPLQPPCRGIVISASVQRRPVHNSEVCRIPETLEFSCIVIEVGPWDVVCASKKHCPTCPEEA